MKLFWFEDRDRFEHNVLVVRAETEAEAKTIAEKAVRESWSSVGASTATSVGSVRATAYVRLMWDSYSNVRLFGDT